MKISTEIGSAAHIVGERRTVELVARAGFDAWDFSMFTMVQFEDGVLLEGGHPLRTAEALKFARELKKIGLDNGIVCNQSHAPYPVNCKAVRDCLCRAIECTAEAGGSICVIHPDNYKGPEENAQMYLELLPFAKACGVKLAAENMWCWDSAEDHACFAACATPESFLAHLNAVNDPDLVACLDVGHAEMRGLGTSAPEIIRALGKRIAALHLHDNDGAADLHQIPGDGSLGFPGLMDEIEAAAPEATLTFECMDGAGCARRLAEYGWLER